MKIGSIVKTKANGLFGNGIIIDKKEIHWFNKKISLYKVESPNFGIEWINEKYLKEIKNETSTNNRNPILHKQH